MYGCPKLIEFESIRSPTLTFRDFLAPIDVIFSSVRVTSLLFAGISPIFTQFTPSSDLVIYSIIGRGELPLWSSITSQNFTFFHGSVKPGKRKAGELEFFSFLVSAIWIFNLYGSTLRILIPRYQVHGDILRFVRRARLVLLQALWCRPLLP